MVNVNSDDEEKSVIASTQKLTAGASLGDIEIISSSFQGTQ
jgi:hypothetical protein